METHEFAAAYQLIKAGLASGELQPQHGGGTMRDLPVEPEPEPEASPTDVAAEAEPVAEAEAGMAAGSAAEAEPATVAPE